MFILPQSTISDLVQITPEDFSKFSVVAIEDNINEKYANKVRMISSPFQKIGIVLGLTVFSKVIQKIGLCIGFYDLLQSSDGLIGHGTGLVNVNVTFRLLVFRPFKGEVILGKILSQDEDGIKIGLEFFEDIFVPKELLFEPSRYDIAENIWVWENDGQPFFYDVNEIVRFRVEAEEWHDQRPTKPEQADGQTQSDYKAPYTIQASMVDSGMGLISWWT
ncbi:hypothetical protein UA08_07805 [Talaromyces atroroseus]|uniref:DNA-directed RNA polymerase subunit n=1 Tax=Talaromyces atroroseus TaxID=1441469 RepID=A0A225ADD1_TALAT|nr:hypothetical protein UA08_07805 [Talaromyces atroroseus]OKL56963.1 hypothetical protein UA08_07805 [Talaromyces atroroseus]